MSSWHWVVDEPWHWVVDEPWHWVVDELMRPSAESADSACWVPCGSLPNVYIVCALRRSIRCWTIANILPLASQAPSPHHTQHPYPLSHLVPQQDKRYVSSKKSNPPFPPLPGNRLLPEYITVGQTASFKIHTWCQSSKAKSRASSGSLCSSARR